MTVLKYDFKAEVKELLNVMIHSLYSHKEIFLRELISNASDAIDKSRYESLTDSRIIDAAGPWKIKIAADKEAGTLTVSDNGIGMTTEEIVKALGMIAHSGTTEFMNALREKDVMDRPELIGQFGVGFYSAFMVAEKVTVRTKKAGGGSKAVVWESTADGSFTVEESEKDTVGTDIVLHIKDEEKKYLDEWELRSIIKKYSDYIEYPIVMEVERERKDEKEGQAKVREEETINSGKAIWLKDKSAVPESDYHEFYRHVSHDYGDPAEVIHYRAEGTSEFVALLFIPAKSPLGILNRDFKIGPALYVKRVQIMDHCEQLIPEYLRFIKGVVDSSDLPLNVSREMLQNNRQIEIIRKNIVRKVLDTLADMKKNEFEKYVAFYKEFGRVLKEGIHYDFSRREQIADLLLFPSTKTGPGAFTTFQDYLGGMPAGQEDIYYLAATTYEEALRSPYIEAFRDKGYEVLIMLDEIDDIIMGGLFEYKGKKVKSVTKGDVSLDKTGDSDKEEAREKFEGLLRLIREELGDRVKEVRLSGRLKDSACCLVGEEGGLDPKMEKILQAMGQEVPRTQRILEINPAHPLIEAMRSIAERDRGLPILKEYIELLYGEAVLLEGSKPEDPSRLVQAVTKLMVENAGHLSK
ncbi:MAG: molecular chaperone HtpG [Nitrospiraceae bacterium]|nr:molecular chaperone HtpG [Nitrospiraceae bacterium]